MTGLRPSNRPLRLCAQHLSIAPHLSQPAADLFGLLRIPDMLEVAVSCTWPAS